MGWDGMGQNYKSHSFGTAWEISIRTTDDDDDDDDDGLGVQHKKLCSKDCRPFSEIVIFLFTNGSTGLLGQT